MFPDECLPGWGKNKEGAQSMRMRHTLAALAAGPCVFVYHKQRAGLILRTKEVGSCVLEINNNNNNHHIYHYHHNNKRNNRVLYQQGPGGADQGVKSKEVTNAHCSYGSHPTPTQPTCFAYSQPSITTQPCRSLS